VVARLRALDPDPDDKITLSFAPGGDGGGRFIIDGDVLRVARSDAFDFARAQSHELTVVATDEAGNQFSRTITVAVQDYVSQFAELDLSLPPGAVGVSLWELAGGGFVVTWLVSNGFFDHRLYSRQVSDNGQALGPDVQLMFWTNSNLQPQFLGVDDAGVAAFLQNGMDNRNDVFDPDTGVTRSTTSRADEIRWIDTADATLLGTYQLVDLSQGTSSRFSDGEANTSFSGSSSGQDSTFVTYRDGSILFSVSSFTAGVASSTRSDGSILSDDDPQVTLSTTAGYLSRTTFATVELFALRYGEAVLRLDSTYAVSTESRSGSSRQVNTFYSDGSFFRDYTSRQAETRYDQTVFYLTPFLSGASGLSGNGTSVVLREAVTEQSFFSSDINGIFDGNSASRTSEEWYIAGPEGKFLVPTLAGDEPGQSEPVIAGFMHDGNHAAAIGRFSVFGESSYQFSRVDTVLRIFHGDGQVREILLGQAGALKDLHSFRVDALGEDAYLVSFLATKATGGEVSLAQVFGLTGNAITEPMIFEGTHRFVVTDKGQVVSFKTSVAPDGTTVVDGSSLVRDIAVVPQEGLDHAGTIIIGSLYGTPNILRLEGGAYQLTASTLIVTGATVYANIGTDTVTPLFKGSFTLDRATGTATNFVTTPLPTGTEAFRLAGLEVTYKGLVLRDDVAAFSASFAVPQGLFGLTDIDLSGPNALEISQHGPEIGGYEFAIPNGKFGLATPGDWVSLNLFEATAKDVKIRYDAGIDEFRSSAFPANWRSSPTSSRPWALSAGSTTSS